MPKSTEKKNEKPPSAEVWFDLKYWKYTLPIVYIGYLTYYIINFMNFSAEIHEFNVDDCVKIEGPSEFKFCEDFLFSNEAGVAYASCDPLKMDHNSVMGVNRLVPGKPNPSGGIWRVNYDQTPASIDKFAIDNADLLNNFHPLGIALDIHPETGVQTLFVVNLPIESKASIEVFTVNDKDLTLTHKRSIFHPKIYNPNSLHLIKDVRFRDKDGLPSFFFSNDHYFHNILLKKVENFVLFWSNVGFYNARLGDIEKAIKGLSFANGLAGTDDVLFVAETYKRDVKQYKVTTTVDSQGIPHVALDYVNEAYFKMAVDNVAYHADKDLVVVAGHAKPYNFVKYHLTNDKSTKVPSQVDIWNTKTGETKVLVQDDGTFYRSSTTGAIDFETSHLVISSILDEGILVCDI